MSRLTVPRRFGLWTRPRDFNQIQNRMSMIQKEMSFFGIHTGVSASHQTQDNVAITWDAVAFEDDPLQQHTWLSGGSGTSISIPDRATGIGIVCQYHMQANTNAGRHRLTVNYACAGGSGVIAKADVYLPASPGQSHVLRVVEPCWMGREILEAASVDHSSLTISTKILYADAGARTTANESDCHLTVWVVE